MMTWENAGNGGGERQRQAERGRCRQEAGLMPWIEENIKSLSRVLSPPTIFHASSMQHAGLHTLGKITQFLPAHAQSHAGSKKKGKLQAYTRQPWAGRQQGQGKVRHKAWARQAARQHSKAAGMAKVVWVKAQEILEVKVREEKKRWECIMSIHH